MVVLISDSVVVSMILIWWNEASTMSGSVVAEWWRSLNDVANIPIPKLQNRKLTHGVVSKGSVTMYLIAKHKRKMKKLSVKREHLAPDSSCF